MYHVYFPVHAEINKNYQVCGDLFKKVTGNMNLELLIIY